MLLIGGLSGDPLPAPCQTDAGQKDFSRFGISKRVTEASFNKPEGGRWSLCHSREASEPAGIRKRIERNGPAKEPAALGLQDVRLKSGKAAALDG